ncbi:hypothetical protein KR044_008036 [Drosophila immigrans]|nr:hypothetical protein KR044_008036 [Drosophila immigrans]
MSESIDNLHADNNSSSSNNNNSNIAIAAANNDGDSDVEVIEGMELLEGNYQVLRQWVPPAPNYWDAPPKAIIKSAEVR